MPSLEDTVTALRAHFGGHLLLPQDTGYEAARHVHNGHVDRRPAVIAQCRGTADVADAIRLSRELGLPLAVRGGGHNVGGYATVEGGLMIDLSLLRSVHVDPAARRAWVDGGATWRDVNRETQHYALATTGGVVSSTGVAGLTLGGGFGWLMARFGLALDNLRAATLTTADSRVVHVSATDEPDLFWAIRGGGGNFGVVTSFEFELHPVGPMVTGGLVVHPFSKASDLLRFFRDQAASAPDELFLVAALLTAPDGSGTKVAAIAAVHSGSPSDGEAAMRPLKAFGQPIMDVLGPMPYTAANMMLDGSFPRGARNYWKSHFLDALSDDAIRAVIDRFDAIPSPMCHVVIEHFHGQATRVPVADTAFALRQRGFNALVLGQWAQASEDGRTIEWTRDTYEAIRPFGGARRYLNYLGEDDAAAATLVAAYGPNLARLTELKRRYDPDNVFRRNQNIPPG